MFADEPRFTSDPNRYSDWLADRLDDYVNISDRERWLCTLGGALLALVGLSRRSILGGLMALVGGAMAQRGLSGHCVVYENLGVNTARPATDEARPAPNEPVAYKPDRHETVDEASWESFPASDSPSWSGGAIT